MMKPQTKKPLSAHLGLVIAEAICISAFVLEISRALSGNTLSWAYVFEWPILGGYAVFMWRKLLHDDQPTTSPFDDDAYEDARLAAYNDYLARVHEAAGTEPPKGLKR